MDIFMMLIFLSMNTVYASNYLCLLQFLSLVSYNFLSTGLLHPWLNLLLGILFFFIYVFVYYLYLLIVEKEEGGKERETSIVVPRVYAFHWLFLVCALIENQTHNLGMLEQHSNQLIEQPLILLEAIVHANVFLVSFQGVYYWCKKMSLRSSG